MKTILRFIILFVSVYAGLALIFILIFKVPVI